MAAISAALKGNPQRFYWRLIRKDGQAFRRIIDFCPNQKAVIVSGFTKTNEVIEAQELGAGAFIPKPFKLEKIGIAIRDELKRKNH